MAAEMSDNDQFVQLKKAILSKTDLNALQKEGGDSNVGELVDRFLKQLSHGIPQGFSWEEAKQITITKFEEVAKKFESDKPLASLSPMPNVDNTSFEEYRQRIVQCLNGFHECAPFTLSRICELLLEPRKHYDRGDKFLRAFEKCVTVTSSNDVPNGNGHVENGNGVNGVNGHSARSAATTINSNEAMDVGNSQPVVNGHAAEGKNTNGDTKQEDAVSSSGVEDQKEENGHILVDADSTEAKSSTDDTSTSEANTLDTGSKRQNEEPDTVSKKVRTEDENETSSSEAEPALNSTTDVKMDGESDKKHKADGAVITNQDSSVDQGTAV